MERSLEARFLFGAGALILFFLLVLLAGDLLVAGSAARDMLNTRIKGTAEISAQNVPFFIETGQNLAVQVAKRPEVLSASGDALNKALETSSSLCHISTRCWFMIDQKNLVGSYSSVSGAQTTLFREEQAGLDLANSGVLSQVYTIPSAAQDQSGPARVSFIIAVVDKATSQTGRILIARTDLANNPFSLPLITGLKSMSDLAGNGILLDEKGRNPV